MLVRILTAVALIPVVIALVLFSPVWLVTAAAAIVVLLTLREFFYLGERVGLKPFQNWAMFCAAGIFYAQYAAGAGNPLVGTADFAIPSLESILLLYIFGSIAISLGTKRLLHEILPAVAIGSAGLLFVALPFSYFVRIIEIPFVGRRLVLFTLCLVWAGDMLAYFVGRSFGHFKMAPVFSPKKTWEGAAANVIASVLVGMLFARWVPISALTLAIIAVLANIAGQVGDIIESVFKRGAAVKDSSSLLPGHGGMFDRIDSLCLAAPVVWIALQLFVFRP